MSVVRAWLFRCPESGAGLCPLSVDMGVRMCVCMYECVFCFPIAMRGVARARVAGEFSLRGYVSD